MTPAFAKLYDQLNAAAIPIVSVDGTDGNATIVYASDATAQQRAQGDSILASFDWAAAANEATQAAANEQTIRQQAVAALTGNVAFLNLASPTQAQTLAQVKALTRQVDGLIRLATNKFDSTT